MCLYVPYMYQCSHWYPSFSITLNTLIHCTIGKTWSVIGDARSQPSHCVSDIPAPPVCFSESSLRLKCICIFLSNVPLPSQPQNRRQASLLSERGLSSPGFNSLLCSPVALQPCPSPWTALCSRAGHVELELTWDPCSPPPPHYLCSPVIFISPDPTGFSLLFTSTAWRIPWTEEPSRLQSIGLQELDTT